MLIYRHIAYTPLPSQRKFHEMPDRYRGFSGPVGSGKSLAVVHEGIRHAFVNPGLLGLIGAPTYAMLRDVTRRAFLAVLEENRIPFRFLKQENHIVLLDTGSEIIFRSMDNPESLVGTNLAWFGVDELTFTVKEAFQRLQARLRHPKASKLCGFAGWTPNGFDWVYEMFVGPEAIYKAVLASPRENKYNAPGFYDELAKSYDPKFAAQEIEGQYLAVFSGRVYHAFDRNLHVEPLRYSQDFDICWALDFNLNPMSSVIFQIERGYNVQPVIKVLDEISLKDRHTQDACAEFKHRLEAMRAGKPGRVNIRVYGDPAGNARQHAGPSDWEAVWDEFRSYSGVSIIRCVDRAHPHVKDRVNAMNAMLMNFQGGIRMKIDPKCRELMADLEHVAWATDSHDNQIGDIDKSDPRRTHMGDTLGYAIFREFGARERGGPVARHIG